MKTAQYTRLALATATLIATTVAHGQGLDPGKLDLTWYGLADVSVVHATSGFGGKTRVEGGGGMQASRLGIRANRTFADGITALATLEAGIGFDTGAAGGGQPLLGVNATNASSGGLPGNGSRVFARQAFAGLRGSFGQVTLGRQYTGSYQAVAGVGSAWGDGFYANSGNLLPLIGGMPTRADNALIYTSPKFAGLTAVALYTSGAENNISTPVAAGATTVTDKSGRGVDFLLRYSQGPINAAVSTWNVKNNSYVTAGETGLATKKGFQIVGNYDFGAALVAASYVSGKISGNNYENVTRVLSKADGWAVSTRIPFGDGGRHNLFLSYTSLNDKSSLNRDAKLYGGAYWYQLETNTRVYVSYGEIKNNANAVYALPDSGNLVGNVVTPGFKPRGAAVGINYAF